MVADIYEGAIFRPPSEAGSLILQATVGCSWNRCTFCVAFTDKTFRVKSLEELKRDVETVYPCSKNTSRIFLADGNALCMPVDELEATLRFLYSRFDRLERVSIYGGPLDIGEKTPEELGGLRKAGLSIVYFGLESGSDGVLKRVKKGATSEMMIETGRKVKEAGLTLSTIFIIGLGGAELTEEHARETARVVSAQDPQYAAALTLMVEPNSRIIRDVEAGELTLLDPGRSLDELRIMVEGLEVSDCVFRANHASNFVTFGGTLPGDKQLILDQIDRARDEGKYKPGFLRRL